MKLPIVSGSNLNRQKRIFPADFRHRFNLVFIAFKRWHQADVDSWVPFAEQLHQRLPTLQYYELPTLPESGFLYRLMLNEGMRAGIPGNATRNRTITLYLDKQEFRHALKIPHEDSMWVYLFDEHGHTLWWAEGNYTPEKGNLIETTISSYLLNVLS